MTKTVLGQKLTTGKKHVAPNNVFISAYLDAAQKGQGSAQKVLKKLK
jgi:hypothetical protein